MLLGLLVGRRVGDLEDFFVLRDLFLVGFAVFRFLDGRVTCFPLGWRVSRGPATALSLVNDGDNVSDLKGATGDVRVGGGASSELVGSIVEDDEGFSVERSKENLIGEKLNIDSEILDGAHVGDSLG